MGKGHPQIMEKKRMDRKTDILKGCRLDARTAKLLLLRKHLLTVSQFTWDLWEQRKHRATRLKKTSESSLS